MRWTKPERVLFTIAVGVFAFLLGLITPHSPQPVGGSAQNRAYEKTENGIPFNDWINLVLTIVITAATWGMWRVSHEQRALLKRANKTAALALAASQKATEQTKRSVDAYLSAERGSMRFYKGGLSEHALRLNFSFKNIGNGSVVLVYFAYHVDYVVGEFGIAHPLLEGQSFSVANEPGGLFTTYPLEGAEPDTLLMIYTAGTLPEIPPDKGGLYVAQFSLIYTDQFAQAFEYRCAVAYDNQTARVFNSPDYTYERDATEKWRAIQKARSA